MGRRSVGSFLGKRDIIDLTELYGTRDDPFMDINLDLLLLHACEYMFIGDYVSTYEVISWHFIKGFTSNI